MTNYKTAIEDLISLNPKIKQYLNDGFLVQEINRGIGTGQIIAGDLQ